MTKNELLWMLKSEDVYNAIVDIANNSSGGAAKYDIQSAELVFNHNIAQFSMSSTATGSGFSFTNETDACHVSINNPTENKPQIAVSLNCGDLPLTLVPRIYNQDNGGFSFQILDATNEVVLFTNLPQGIKMDVIIVGNKEN